MFNFIWLHPSAMREMIGFHIYFISIVHLDIATMLRKSKGDGFKRCWSYSKQWKNIPLMNTPFISSYSVQFRFSVSQSFTYFTFDFFFLLIYYNHCTVCTTIASLFTVNTCERLLTILFLCSRLLHSAYRSFILRHSHVYYVSLPTLHVTRQTCFIRMTFNSSVSFTHMHTQIVLTKPSSNSSLQLMQNWQTVKKYQIRLRRQRKNAGR